MKKYRRSIKGILTNKKAKYKYCRTEKYKAASRKYKKSLLGYYNRLKCHCNERAAKMNIIETFTKKELKNKIELCNGRCPKCNKPFDNKIHLITIDHIYPVSLAYKDYISTGIKRVYSIEDITPLCKSCNSSKGCRL